MNEIVPIGTRVRYHDTERIMRNNPAEHPDQRVRAVAAQEYPDGTGYELWPAGVPDRFGNRHLATYWVRRTSFEVISEISSEDNEDDDSAAESREGLYTAWEIIENGS